MKAAYLLKGELVKPSVEVLVECKKIVTENTLNDILVC